MEEKKKRRPWEVPELNFMNASELQEAQKTAEQFQIKEPGSWTHVEDKMLCEK